MEEKTLASSEHYAVKMVTIILIALGLAVLIFSFIASCSAELTTYRDFYNYNVNQFNEHQHSSRCSVGYPTLGLICGFSSYKTAEEYANARHPKPSVSDLLSCWGEDLGNSIIPVFTAVLVLIGVMIYFAFGKNSMVVTNRRVYGCSLFGKRVDIPNDSISAISITGILKGVVVASSSGKIGFYLIKNANEIYTAINQILIQRQGDRQKPTEEKQKTVQSNADELRKYKELLDMGAITQDEFDAKKKQLLEL